MRGSFCRLHMQLSALRVDEAVLNVAAATNNEGTLVASKAPTNYLSSLTHSSGSQQAGGGDSSSGSQYRAAPLGAAKSSGGGLYPSRWRKQSDQLITEAQQLAVDSSRWERSAHCTMLQHQNAVLLCLQRQTERLGPYPNSLHMFAAYLVVCLGCGLAQLYCMKGLAAQGFCFCK